MKGHDGSTTSFAVQLPSGRHCRREDRTAQIFRTLNGYVVETPRYGGTTEASLVH